jgi:hypothetical protein
MMPSWWSLVAALLLPAWYRPHITSCSSGCFCCAASSTQLLREKVAAYLVVTVYIIHNLDIHLCWREQDNLLFPVMLALLL